MCSFEHGLGSRRPIRTERVRRVAHGWNIDSAVGSASPGLSTLCLQGWNGSGGSGSAGARCWVLRDQASCQGVSSDVLVVGVGPAGPSLGCMKRTCWVRGVWCRSYVENYTVDASIFRFASSARAAPCGWCCVVALDRNFNLCGQVSKSKRWMPWHLEPKKDVEICDKPRGADNRAVIRGFPNGETPPGDLSTW